MLRKFVSILTLVLLIVITGCVSEINDTNVSNEPECILVNESSMSEPPSKNEIVVSDEKTIMEIPIEDEEYTDDACPIEIIELFQPKDTEMLMEGELISVRLYPFGEIVEQGVNGQASYVIFIEADYYVMQYNNLLRVIPSFNMPSDIPPVFMEDGYSLDYGLFRPPSS